MALKDLIQTFKKKIMPIFFFALAIYTLITLIQSAAEVSRKTLKLSDTRPSGRCVGFFDHVTSWHDDNKNTSIVLYDYIAGEAIVRICTNKTNTTVTQEMIGHDGAEAYTPFAQQGCPLNQPSMVRGTMVQSNRAWIGDPSNDGCVRVGTEAQNTACRDILDWRPCPATCIYPPCCQGWGFKWDVQVWGGKNFTNTSTNRVEKYPACTTRFEAVQDIPVCYGNWVGIFHTKAAHLEVFLWIVVAVPLIVMCIQGFFLWGFDPAPPYDDDWRVSFAMRGAIGPLYQFWWVYFGRPDTPFPQAKLKLPAWAACATQDAIEGLVSPIVAVYGCSLDRFPIQLVLIILKCIKFIVDAVMYFKDDGDDNGVDPSKTDQLMMPQQDPSLAAAGFGNGQPMMMGGAPQQQPGMMMSPNNGMPPQQQGMMMNNGMPPQPMMAQPQGGVPPQQQQYSNNAV